MQIDSTIENCAERIMTIKELEAQQNDHEKKCKAMKQDSKDYLEEQKKNLKERIEMID
jgi:hypothetical protein